MAATPKKRKPADERDEALLRLRKYLGKYATRKPDFEGWTYAFNSRNVCGSPMLTDRMFEILYRIDESMVGTPDYMGIAYWWARDYRHIMRDATTRERVMAHHAVIEQGLPVGGASQKHEEIIMRSTKRSRARWQSLAA
jgi:hypothetical protein